MLENYHFCYHLGHPDKYFLLGILSVMVTLLSARPCEQLRCILGITLGIADLLHSCTQVRV